MEFIAHVFQLAEEREKSQCLLHVDAVPANRCPHLELNVVMTGPGIMQTRDSYREHRKNAKRGKRGVDKEIASL